jgi:hypothetical protein
LIGWRLLTVLGTTTVEQSATDGIAPSIGFIPANRKIVVRQQSPFGQSEIGNAGAGVVALSLPPQNSTPLKRQRTL